VTFDLWETLIFDDPNSDEARGRMRYEGLRSVLADKGVKLSTEDLRWAYEQSGTTLQVVWNRYDEVPIIDQIRLILEMAAGKPVALDSSWIKPLEDAYVNPILSIPPKLSKEVPTVLEAVGRRGYKVGLISNTGRSPGNALRELLNMYGVLKFFDTTVFSNEVLRRKPDRVIFDHAARLLNAEKSAIVHVGDNPDADYWGAKDAGMQAVLLDQSRPESSGWGPNSLYALARANIRRDESGIEPRLRVKSLTEIADLLDQMLED
jgi:putative hydrolase of the HAD superfamily